LALTVLRLHESLESPATCGLALDIEAVLITEAEEDVPAPAASKSEGPISYPDFHSAFHGTTKRIARKLADSSPFRRSMFKFKLGANAVYHVMPSYACPPSIAKTNKRDKKGRYRAASMTIWYP